MKLNSTQKTPNNKYSDFIRNSHSFLVLFFERVNIHGFSYFGLQYLQVLEKLFWLVLVTVAFCATILLSLQSLYRYENKSTVVSIERDHYYWNTSLPSFTICPVVNRIDGDLFETYCVENGIKDQRKKEFYNFIESMANATYDSFHLIKDYDSIESMNINPKDYMMLIYNLTQDQLRNVAGEQRVRAFRNLDFIGCEQILTEQGICYTSNSFLAPNLSAQYLLTGVQPTPLNNLDFYQDRTFYDVISGNLFDGDKSYSMVGFSNEVTIYVHSPFETMNIAKMKYYAKNSYEFLCSSTEIVAHQNILRDTSVSQRHCRFNSESNLTHYAIYTRGLCLQECRLELVYKLCGCIPHFYPNKIYNPKPVCSYKTLKQCVAPKRQMLLELRTVEYGKVKSIDCNCLQNCVDSDVFINGYKVLVDTNELLGTIGGIVIVREYPLVRYKRKILFSLTDLYVSIGATGSFFTGFCVLGIIEVVYFFTIRLFWHVLGKKIQPIELSGKTDGSHKLH